MPRVLVVEDDAPIRTVLVRALTEQGYAVSSAATGRSGLEVALETCPDLILLDLKLPDLDGTEILKMLRAVSSVPVIVATARDEETAIVDALNNGADDYVVKPFSAEHLDARIGAVLRRASPDQVTRTLRVGELAVDPRSREARLAGRLLELSPKEFELLASLAARVGQVVTKRELLVEVWRQPYGGADKTVDVHMSWLRRKLGEPADAPRYLHTVRGVGVKLVEP